MSKITDTTALNVLCRTSQQGTTEADFYHSKVYQVKEAIDRLTQKGYKIQTRRVTNGYNQGEMCWFINLKEIQKHAVEKRRAQLGANHG